MYPPDQFVRGSLRGSTPKLLRRRHLRLRSRDCTDVYRRGLLHRYGICELTGSSIEPERLAAVPWTRYSEESQRIAEANGFSPAIFQKGRPPRQE